MNTPSVLIPWKPLYPSQRSGAVIHERAFWRGEERQFIIQWHEDRAYFGLCDGKLTMWATLEECTEDDALACFEDALQTRRYGVCFNNNCSVWRENFSMELQFIYAPDGTGLLREWSSRDWIPFAPKQTRAWAWAMFPDLMLPTGDTPPNPSAGCCYEAAHCVENELLMRHVSDEEVQQTAFRSNVRCEEFERVTRLLWDADFLRANKNSRTPNSVMCGNWGKELNGYFYLYCDWSVKKTMVDWFRAYLTPYGFERRIDDWGKRRFRKLRAREPRLRAWLHGQYFHWRISFSGEPSFHEQLEARLLLRDWLRDKAPAAQIESWLGSSL